MAKQDQAHEHESPERSFEQALGELEQRVRSLDAGELPLEEALKRFEEGVALVQECHEKLDVAERRIVELTAAPETPEQQAGHEQQSHGQQSPES